MVRSSFQIPQRARPVLSAKGVAVNFDFSAVNQISGDLTQEQLTDAIDFVQSIFIDNRLNAQAFVISFAGLGYTIQVRPGRQGIWPVITSTGALQFTAVSTNAGIVIPTIMFNEEMPYFFWDV